MEAKRRQEEEAKAAAARAAAEKVERAAREKEEAARKAQEEKERAAQASKEAAQSAAAAASAAAAPAAAPPQAPPASAAEVKGSPGALAWREQLAGLLAKARGEVAAFKADPATKAARRAVDKALTVNVQQISASRDQVAKKATAIQQLLLSQPAGPPATYAQLQLASKLCVQCEVQVTRLPGFAFPLAEVAVAVCARVPGFVELLVAQLAALCPLCAPALVVPRPGKEDDAQALRLQGYKITKDPDTGQVGGAG